MASPIVQRQEVDPALLEQVPGSVLLPYQQRWITDDAPVKVIEKSRRIGVSWAEAADDALYAASKEGANVYYMAYNQEMTQQFIKDCAFWARFYDLAASEIEEIVLEDDDRDVKVYQITFASGNIIQALSSAPRNLRSKGAPGERVVLDEFGFHGEQEELLKAAMAFTVWGGQVRIISTHNGVENPFNQLVKEIREGRKPYSLHRVTIEEAIDEGFYQRICLIRGKEWSPEIETEWLAGLVATYGDGADEELFCVPRRSGGRYFSRILVEECMSDEIPVVRLELNDEFSLKPEYERVRIIEDWCHDNLKPHVDQADPNLKSFFGEDFARSGDLTVLIPAQQQTDLVRRWLFACELRNVPFEAQKQIVFFIISRLPRFVSAAFDASGNGSYLAEVTAMQFGLGRVHQVKLNATWYLENMAPYKAALEDRKVEMALDADILDDHGDVVVQNGVPLVPAGSRKGSDGKQRHGDSAIAAALLWFAGRQGGAPIDFKSTGEQRASDQAYRDTIGEERAVIDHDTGFGVLRGKNRFSGWN